MTTQRRTLIAGNWKMNGLVADGTALAAEVARRYAAVQEPRFDMLVCPPFTLVSKVAEAAGAGGLAVGGQDCHPAVKGAHTGDIAASMLKDLGCSYVIVGHSERRTDHREVDADIKSKAEAALAAGLTAIVCIGETEQERDGGRTLDVVKTQLSGSLPDGADAANLVIAYEPVWAIGTGRTPTNEEVQDVHAKIRKELAGRLGPSVASGIRILYGGSMKPSNAEVLLALPDVDGGLIGGASLTADDFWACAKSCL